MISRLIRNLEIIYPVIGREMLRLPSDKMWIVTLPPGRASVRDILADEVISVRHQHNLFSTRIEFPENMAMVSNGINNLGKSSAPAFTLNGRTITVACFNEPSYFEMVRVGSGKVRLTNGPGVRLLKTLSAALNFR